jgi:hypothetical protein
MGYTIPIGKEVLMPQLAIYQPVTTPQGYRGRIIEIVACMSLTEAPAWRYAVLYDEPHPSPWYPEFFPKFFIDRDVFTENQLVPTLASV